MTNAPPRPAKRAFTGRAAVLAVVLLGLLVTIAYPLQEYLRQRGELAALHDQRSTLQASVDALNAESARWKDPAFVKQQAKERLYFVAPGEKTYVVIGAPDAAAPTAAPRSATDALSGTWYERVWSTVAAAGKATGKASSGATQSATGASGAAK